MKPLILRDVVQSRGAGNRRVTVLNGVVFEVDRGECVLVEGPSGSGKTTLLATGAGLITPDSGEVLLGGTSLHTLQPAERCLVRSRRLGFVFQRANLLAGLTVRENVGLAGQLAGMPRNQVERRARELLQLLGIASLSDRHPHELSGGEEQRVAVARALVHGPEIVLADEPTGNLDWVAGKSVAETLVSAAVHSGTAVVVATHDDRLAPMATRRVHLLRGVLM